MTPSEEWLTPRDGGVGSPTRERRGAFRVAVRPGDRAFTGAYQAAGGWIDNTELYPETRSVFRPNWRLCTD